MRSEIMSNIDAQRLGTTNLNRILNIRIVRGREHAQQARCKLVLSHHTLQLSDTIMPKKTTELNGGPSQLQPRAHTIQPGIAYVRDLQDSLAR